MIQVGRLCMKVAGRDAGHKCVVIEVIDDNFVLIDGDVRRKRCNILHLEPLKDILEIKKGASHEHIVSEFKKLGIELKAKKSRQAKPKPKRIRKRVVRARPVQQPAAKEKKTVKKTAAKKE